MSDPALHDAARARLVGELGDLPPQLGAAWTALQQDLCLWGQGDRPPYFLHPMALPVVQLPGWIGQTSGLRVDAAGAGACAMAGYLHVRIRDDALDLDQPAQPGRLLLSDRLLQLHLRLLMELGGPAMLLPAMGLWTSFSEAMLIETLARQTGASIDGATFDQLLDRSRPMLLPALAVLPGRAEDPQAAELGRFVDGLVRAHQLLNDLVDLEADQAAGARTWLLSRAGEAPGPAGLARWLLLAGGLDAVCLEIEDAMATADHAAAGLGMGAAAPWLAARRALNARLRQQVQTAALRRLLASGGG